MLRLNLKPTLAGDTGTDARRCFGFRKLRTLVHADEGQALVEFAVAFPVLMVMLLGIVVFGIFFWNQLTLTSATNTAAQTIMSGPGVITDPCASANTAISLAAPSLNNKNIYGSYPLSFTIQAYTTTSASTSAGPYSVVFGGAGPSCTTLASSLTQGQQVVVTATYGCNLQLFGFNAAPNCKLSAQTSEAVQ